MRTYSQMSINSYEIAGPFSDAAKSLAPDHIISHNVTLKAERNTAHPLNPVGHLRRVVSGHHHVVQEAVLLLGMQFFEIFTVVHEQRDQSQQGRTTKLKSRIRSVAQSATGHLPKRLRRDAESEGETQDELEALQLNAWEQELGDAEGILKDHVFSCGVAFAQVVKIKSRGHSITVYYHPNSMKTARLSKNNLASAMRFTFCLESQEEATQILVELERRMTRYSQAALFLGEQVVLPSSMHIVAVTQPLGDNGSTHTEGAELLLQKDAPWGSTVSAPASWGPQASDSETPLWVFLMTPLGYGKCEISPQVVSLYMKGREASFFVGVRHPQVTGAALTTVSKLRPSTSSAHDESESPDGDDSDENWQPEDQESFTLPSSSLPSLQHTATHTSKAAAETLKRNSHSTMVHSKGQGAISRGRGASSHGVGDRHIRVHCSAKFVVASSAMTRPRPGFSAYPVSWRMPGGDLLRSLRLSYGQFAAAAGVVAVVLWLLSSWIALLTILNVGAAVFTLMRGKAGFVPSKPGWQTGRTSALGIWQIKLIKAEVVTDEPWSAAGESILADVGEDNAEGSAEQRKQRVAAEFGFSNDTVERYMLAFHGDEVLAHRKMRATHEWRKVNGINGILSQPQPHFRFFKEMFRHALLGTTKQGHPVWFMKVGDMKQGHKIFRGSGLTMRDLARHVALCMDYMYTVVEPENLPNGRALWVLDLKGMGLSDMGSDAFEMGKQIAGMISAHWPERLYRSFIINMPGFFSILWKLVEPMLASNTRKKIRLLRGKTDMLREMLEEMDVNDIPVEYGGKLEGEVYSARKEKKFWEYVEKLGTALAHGQS